MLSDKFSSQGRDRRWEEGGRGEQNRDGDGGWQRKKNLIQTFVGFSWTMMQSHNFSGEVVMERD